MLNEAELKEVADVCRRHDLVAVTDEVYEHLVFDGRRHMPLATFEGMRERTVTVSSAGKSFSVTGWKVGWACAPPNLLAGVRAAKQFLTYVTPAPLQRAAAAGLRATHQLVDPLVEELQDNRDLLAKGLSGGRVPGDRRRGDLFLDRGHIGTDGRRRGHLLPGTAAPLRRGCRALLCVLRRPRSWTPPGAFRFLQASHCDRGGRRAPGTASRAEVSVKVALVQHDVAFEDPSWTCGHLAPLVEGAARRRGAACRVDGNVRYGFFHGARTSCRTGDWWRGSQVPARYGRRDRSGGVRVVAGAG